MVIFFSQAAKQMIKCTLAFGVKTFINMKFKTLIKNPVDECSITQPDRFLIQIRIVHASS